uniref:Uncharacterized protein n=1 Tax=virus sp. ctEQ64 TaxID=2825809 RepID=A0A8S5RKG4_9VIRU|nr:MAG TPA: hypothetical protein [virus sp. ctEQ64]
MKRYNLTKRPHHTFTIRMKKYADLVGNYKN